MEIGCTLSVLPLSELPGPEPDHLSNSGAPRARRPEIFGPISYTATHLDEPRAGAANLQPYTDFFETLSKVAVSLFCEERCHRGKLIRRG